MAIGEQVSIQQTKGITHYLQTPTKRLRLEIHGDLAVPFIENTPARKQGDIPDGSTSQLMLQAGEIIKQEAIRMGRPITIFFESTNPHLKDWCNTKGNAIFGWDFNEEVDMNGERRRFASKELGSVTSI